MAIRILSSENISGEVLIASGKYLSWGTAGATSIEGSTVSNKLQFRTNSTDAVTIDSSQNVGIGTSTPTAKLEVNVASGDGILIKSADVSTFKMKGGGGVYDWGLATTNLAASDFGIYKSNAGGGDPITAGTAQLYFKSTGSTTSNVGIGTTSPTYNLVVSNGGASGVEFAIASATGLNEMLSYNRSTSVFEKLRAQAKQFEWYTDATANALVIQSGGNVGIGTDSPDYTLHLLKSSGDTEMYINGQNGQSSLRMGLDLRNWQIKTAASPYLWSLNYVGGDFQTPNIITAKTTGNVGIGTASPGAKLEIKATGSTTGLTFKTTDASGNENFFIQDGGRTGVRYYPFTIGQASGTSAASGARFQIATTAGDFVVLNDGKTGIGTTTPDGKLEVAGGTTLGFRLSNAGDSSAYDQVRMTYTGYNSGSPTVTFMPLTTPGGGNVYTTFLFQNTNGVNASSNNNANVAIDGTLQVGRSKGLGETTLIMNNYDTSLAGLNQIQNSIRMSGRYWSGSGSQLVETRINSVHQESDGNGGSALTFMTQTGGSAVVEQMRIDKVGNVGIGQTSPDAKLHVSGTSTQLMLETPNSTNDIDFRFRENGTNKWNIRYQNATEDLQILNQIGPTIVQMHFGSNPAKVGIGNVNPTGRLTVEDDNGNQLHLRHSNTASGRYWNFDVASDSKLYVLNEQGTGVYIAHGATSWTGTSDESLKENIKPLENVLDKIKDYRCVEYNLKNVPDDKKIGFIAQDWKNDFAPIVDEDNDGLLGMKYTETIPVLLKAIQELKAEIEILKNK